VPEPLDPVQRLVRSYKVEHRQRVAVVVAVILAAAADLRMETELVAAVVALLGLDY